MRGDPIIDVGVIGPLEMLSDRRPLGPVREDAGLLLVELASDCRRCGVESDEAERESEEMVRGRAMAPGLSAPGVSGVVGLVASWEVREAAVAGVASSSSCHCKCRMTDFVAHY